MPGPPRRATATNRKRDTSKMHQDGVSSLGMVYVNEIARHALLSEKKPQFPVGSVIVREKLAHADSAAPDLLVVMIKREPAFNPKANGWEFLTLDGTGSKIRHRQKRGACQSCHARQKGSDFVYRTYLEEEARLKQQ